MPKILKSKSPKSKKKATAKKAPTPKKTKAKATQAKAKPKKKTKSGTETMPVRQPLNLPEKMKHDEPGPAAELPPAETKAEKPKADTKYKLEVDGALKSEYPTQEIAMAVALQLKRKFPHIRVAIVDSAGQDRIAVNLPQAAA